MTYSFGHESDRLFCCPRTLKDPANINLGHVVDSLYEKDGVGSVICTVLPIVIIPSHKVLVVLD
jgi:hypothetical protein